MESEAKGCEVVVTGKLRAARAKVMKFVDGYMIKTGEPSKHYLDTATRHVLMRQGVLGIKVTIMLPYDPTGKLGGTSYPLQDTVSVIEPKDDGTSRDVVPMGTSYDVNGQVIGGAQPGVVAQPAQ